MTTNQVRMTIAEIKKMTGQELADYMTDKCYYTGVTEGLYFEVEIDGYKVPYEIEIDSEGTVNTMVEMGILKEEEVEDYLENGTTDESDFAIECKLRYGKTYDYFIERYYFNYEREVDKYLISSNKDYVVETLEENLEEIKDNRR